LPLTEGIKVSELFILIYDWTKLRHFTVSFLMVSYSLFLLYNYNLIKIFCLFIYSLHNYSTYWKSGNWISWKKNPVKVYAYTVTIWFLFISLLRYLLIYQICIQLTCLFPVMCVRLYLGRIMIIIPQQCVSRYHHLWYSSALSFIILFHTSISNFYR
jgi:hypothetical protein